MPRGRKKCVPSDLLTKIILQYKDKIIINNKVVPKSSIIWQEIADQLSNSGQVKASSLYTFVTCDRYNLHKLLNIKSSKTDLCRINYKNKNDSQKSDSSESFDILHNNTFNRSSDRIFVIALSKREFESLLETKIYKKRICTRFKSKEWADVLAQKIWNETRIQCGINFKNHYLTQNADYGHINGKYILLCRIF